MRHLLRLLCLAVVGAVAIPAPTAAASSGYLPPVGDDYPVAALHAERPDVSLADLRQCGTFALWRVDRDKHRAPFTTVNALAAARPIVNAADIDDAARAAGLHVDRTPAVGAVAVLEDGQHEAGPHGHAAYVARVYGDGAVLVEQYNWDRVGEYEALVVAPDWASEYVHF